LKIIILTREKFIIFYFLLRIIRYLGFYRVLLPIFILCRQNCIAWEVKMCITLALKTSWWVSCARREKLTILIQIIVCLTRYIVLFMHCVFQYDSRVHRMAEVTSFWTHAFFCDFEGAGVVCKQQSWPVSPRLADRGTESLTVEHCG